jgi:hypothetical protein
MARHQLTENKDVHGVQGFTTVHLQQSTICINTPGMNLIESLILQAWRSLMTQT